MQSVDVNLKVICSQVRFNNCKNQVDHSERENTDLQEQRVEDTFPTVAINLMFSLLPTSLAPYDNLGGEGRDRKKSEQHLLGSRQGSEQEWETRLERTTVQMERGLECHLQIPNLQQRQRPMYCEVLIGKLAHDVGISESQDQGISNKKALN